MESAPYTFAELQRLLWLYSPILKEHAILQLLQVKIMLVCVDVRSLFSSHWWELSPPLANFDAWLNGTPSSISTYGYFFQVVWIDVITCILSQKHSITRAQVIIWHQ